MVVLTCDLIWEDRVKDLPLFDLLLAAHDVRTGALLSVSQERSFEASYYTESHKQATDYASNRERLNPSLQLLWWKPLVGVPEDGGVSHFGYPVMA